MQPIKWEKKIANHIPDKGQYPKYVRNYHIISPISVTQSTKQTSKQNRAKDMEIKNKLTVTRGEGAWRNGEGRRRVIKEHV